MDWKLGFFFLLRSSGRVRFCKLSWGHISKFYVIFPAFRAIFTTSWAHLAEIWHSVKDVFALHVFNHLEIRLGNFSPFWPLKLGCSPFFPLKSLHLLSHSFPRKILLVWMHVCVCDEYFRFYLTEPYNLLPNATGNLTQLVAERGFGIGHPLGRRTLRNKAVGTQSRWRMRFRFESESLSADFFSTSAFDLSWGNAWWRRLVVYNFASMCGMRFFFALGRWYFCIFFMSKRIIIILLFSKNPLIAEVS